MASPNGIRLAVKRTLLTSFWIVGAFVSMVISLALIQRTIT